MSDPTALLSGYENVIQLLGQLQAALGNNSAEGQQQIVALSEQLKAALSQAEDGMKSYLSTNNPTIYAKLFPGEAASLPQGNDMGTAAAQPLGEGEGFNPESSPLVGGPNSPGEGSVPLEGNTQIVGEGVGMGAAEYGGGKKGKRSASKKNHRGGAADVSVDVAGAANTNMIYNAAGLITAANDPFVRGVPGTDSLLGMHAPFSAGMNNNMFGQSLGPNITSVIAPPVGYVGGAKKSTKGKKKH
jgi:hypothetical protein